jgi:hypothetical protein
MHIAKELADELKSKNIFCVQTDKQMQVRLKFYGITKCEQLKLRELDFDSKESGNVTISYKNKTLYKADVTNVNN